MSRLCERPGCSQPADVAYGMDSSRLLVWLERVSAAAEPSRPIGAVRINMLCRRHADAMVVPRGWTLDDRRESRPRLFRVSEAPATIRPKRAPRRARAVGDDTQTRLLLDEAAVAEAIAAGERLDAASAAASMHEPVSAEAPLEEIGEDEITVGDIRPLGEPIADETRATPWRFSFDETDDLDGELRASSPLLSRAFNGNRALREPSGAAD